MEWQVNYKGGSLYLPQIDLWCDSRLPVACSFVSHAHFDHLAAHQKIITSQATRRLMAERLPGKREEIVLPFNPIPTTSGTGISIPSLSEPYVLNGKTEVRLFPAGHILGSAMLHLTHEGSSLLYTGDFKLRAGKSAEVCFAPQADVLVMETTFGLPRYVFPPEETVFEKIVTFCQQVLEEGDVPILFGYSLGKSQEILSGLAGAGLPVMLHPQAFKITAIYEELGIVFPPYKKLDFSRVNGHVVIGPRSRGASSWVQKISSRRLATVTGWALDPSAIYRYQCDAAFPLSDHADYPDLLRLVERVQPKEVYTVHGFKREFAQVLRQRGISAWALGAENQLEFQLFAEDGV